MLIMGSQLTPPVNANLLIGLKPMGLYRVIIADAIGLVPPKRLYMILFGCGPYIIAARLTLRLILLTPMAPFARQLQ